VPAEMRRISQEVLEQQMTHKRAFYPGAHRSGSGPGSLHQSIRGDNAVLPRGRKSGPASARRLINPRIWTGRTAAWSILPGQLLECRGGGSRSVTARANASAFTAGRMAPSRSSGAAATTTATRPSSR